MSDRNWNRNVGTAGNPVTLLHEYAVGILWDAAQEGLGNHSVRILTESGKLSGNILDGIAEVRIPTNLTPIGAHVPDLAFFDKDGRPIRIVEVTVTSGPSKKKAQDMANFGIELIETKKLAKPDDLRDLVWRPKEFRFGRDLGFELKYGSSTVLRIGELRNEQRKYDLEMDKFINSLLRCTPQKRREFLDAVQAISDIEALMPLSRDNPKRKTLADEAFDIGQPDDPKVWFGGFGPVWNNRK